METVMELGGVDQHQKWAEKKHENRSISAPKEVVKNRQSQYWRM